MAIPSAQDPSKKRAIRLITHALWLLCIPIFIGIGLFGWELLNREGVPTLERTEAIELFLPFAFFHLIPVFVLSVALRRACLQAFYGDLSRRSAWLLRVIDPSIDFSTERNLRRVLYSVLGASIGLLALVSMSLLGGVLYTGPGGFAEVVLMAWVVWPLTIGYLLLFGLLGAAIGGLVGSWLFRATRKSATDK